MNFQETNTLYKSITYLYMVDFQNAPSVATGFFIRFNKSDSVYLVTARHCVENKKIVTAAFRKSEYTCSQNEAVYCQNFSEKIIYHPNDKIDLAAIKIPHEFPAGLKLEQYVVDPILESKILTIEEIQNLNYVEDVIVFGCPRGLWSTQSSLCIATSGITSTPIAVPYSDTIDFIINSSLYPGSSGSPVFVQVGNILKLAGITVKVHHKDVGTDSHNQIIYDHLNLCDILSSQKLLELADLL